jgi:hypothetical protein
MDLKAGMEDLTVAAGTVIGREHVRLGRNNQDGVAVHLEDGLIVAAVTDGCSSARASEVGARLAAEWIVARAPEYLAWFAGASPAELANELLSGLVDYVGRVARDLAPCALGELFLFTVLAAIVDEERTIVFGLGDGVFSLNGAVTRLESGEHNAPKYAAYRLLGSSLLELDPGSLEPAVHVVTPTAELESLIIATDGALELEERRQEPMRDGDAQGGLDALCRLEGLRTNATLLHKRLNAIGAVAGRLRDDTSVVAITRRPR